MARNSDWSPGVYPSGSSTRKPGYTRKNRANSSRVVCVKWGRAPFSICERYAWLKPRPTSLFIALASSCCVIERPKPRSEPSTARRERSLSPSFMGDSLIAICKYGITNRYFVKRNRHSPVSLCIWLNLNDLLCFVSGDRRPQTSLRCKPDSFRFPERLQIDSQLLAFLVEVTALQSQCTRNIRHMEIVPPNFREHNFPFERFSPFGQRAHCTPCGSS